MTPTPQSEETLDDLILFDRGQHDKNCGVTLTHDLGNCDCNKSELKLALTAYIDGIMNEVIGEDIVFYWKPANEVQPLPDNAEHDQELVDLVASQDWLVCTVCTHYKDDPEYPHTCELDNENNSTLRTCYQAIKKARGLPHLTIEEGEIR